MTNFKTVNLHLHIYHLYIDKTRCIGIKYIKNKVIDVMLESWGNAKWSERHHMMYVPNTKTNLNRIYNDFRGVAWVDSQHFLNQKSRKNYSENINSYKTLVEKTKLGPCPESYLNKLISLNYALSTCKTYITLFKKFAYHHVGRDINKLDDRDVTAYLVGLAKEDASKSKLNQTVNAIKFYYEVVLEMPNRFYNIDRPKKSNTLPVVISKKNVFDIIDGITNLKHKSMVVILYSSGLRRSELFNLRIKDVDSQRMTLFIKDSKGSRDRYVPLSKSALDYLRMYYKEYRPKELLFEGLNGEKYSGSSLNKILKRAVLKAGINTRVTSHTMRHSFATHLLEEGINLRTIQVILGHRSTKTTEIYTHIANKRLENFENPFDTGILRSNI